MHTALLITIHQIALEAPMPAEQFGGDFSFVAPLIIMTGEPAHTSSKERIAPELIFLSEHVPQVSITDSKVK